MGSVIYEVVVQTAELPTRWDQRQIRPIRVSGAAGGASGNAAVNAARLGAPVRHIGKACGQPWADLIRKAYAEAGVDTRWLREVEGEQGSVLVLFASPTGEWTVLAPANAAIAMGPEDIDESVMAGATFAVTDSFSLFTDLQKAGAQRFFDLAKQVGAKVAVDACVDLAATQPEYLRSVAAQCDLFFANEREACLLTGAENAVAALDGMAQLGCRVAVLKAGTKGVFAVGPGMSPIWVPAYATTVVDTIGAGDGLVGGTIAGLSRGLPLPDALRLGAATAALTCRGSGSLSYPVTAQEAEALIRAGETLPAPSMKGSSK